MRFIKEYLSLARFDDDMEKTQRAVLLYAASLVLFFAPIILIFLNQLIGGNTEPSVNGALVLIVLIQIPTQYLMRTGRLNAAGTLLLFTGWAAMTWIASQVDGVGDVAVVSYFVIILGAGYLLGWRAVTLLTTWSILAVWTLAIFEQLGLIRPVPGDPVRIAIDLTVIFVIASLEIYFVIHTLKQALKKTQDELRERRGVEAALRSEQEKLSLALQASRMETWEWNIETGAVSWSAGVEALFGIRQGYFDGKYETYLSLIHPEDLPSVQQAIREVLEDTKRQHYFVEHRLFHTDGSQRWLDGRGQVYRDENGRPVRMAGTVMDVTDRKRAEAEREKLIRELAAKNTELEQFTYTVSHDLKAPIITIKGFLGFLAEDMRAGNTERAEKDMVRITDAVDRMNRLLNELLELSRVGRMMNEPQEIGFGRLVEEAVELLQGRLKMVSPRLEIADDLPVVSGDRRRLLEVVQNLLDNAIKFSSENPLPMVSVGYNGKENGHSVFFVKDNGIGIPLEHHERIFGLFSKLDPSAEGTGIGLTLVKRIVEFHGGTVWVESEAGCGATFFFTLPSPAKLGDSNAK